VGEPVLGCPFGVSGVGVFGELVVGQEDESEVKFRILCSYSFELGSISGVEVSFELDPKVKVG
jgi:hypothetical protein